MIYQIELHPYAQDELAESYQWYEERLEGLGSRFFAAIQKKFDSIMLSPQLYPKKKGNYREVSVKDFPFTIIYEVLEKQKIVFVSYVFHTKRDPRLKYKR